MVSPGIGDHAAPSGDQISRARAGSLPPEEISQTLSSPTSAAHYAAMRAGNTGTESTGYNPRFELMNRGQMPPATPNLDSLYPDQNGRAHAKYAGLQDVTVNGYPDGVTAYRALDQGIYQPGQKTTGPQGKGWDWAIGPEVPQTPGVKAAQNAETDLQAYWTQLHKQVQDGKVPPESDLLRLDKLSIDFINKIADAYPNFRDSQQGRDERKAITKVYVERARAMLYVKDATAKDM